MGWLEDQSVVITGAGSGLGQALVERFVAEGARVVGFDRSPEKLAALEAAHDGAVATVAGDVRSAQANQEAVDLAVSRFGRLDTFVGNAGLWDFNGSLLDTPVEQLDRGFDELFAVNVKGYILGAKAAAPALRESRGSMLFTLSNAAFYPTGGGPLYVASKHAGVGLIRQLAYELAPEVRVNGVGPGGMNTDLRGPAALGLAGTTIGDVPVDDYMREHSALKFAPTAEDYVGPYVLLAARGQSATITGATLDASSITIPARPAVPAEV